MGIYNTLVYIEPGPRPTWIHCLWLKKIGGEIFAAHPKMEVCVRAIDRARSQSPAGIKIWLFGTGMHGL
jgi:hypothetical protein